ncbi:MAG: hypothetical protein PHU04_05695 [Candidatus Peribacteraceae bacterium]|nr:hypothetical protein [Candidatus Peribacteraceae bacterium]
MTCHSRDYESLSAEELRSSTCPACRSAARILEQQRANKDARIQAEVDEVNEDV